MKNICSSTTRLFFVAQMIILFAAMEPVFGQSGVRIARTTGTADPSAVLDVVSDGTPTWKGFLLPRMTSAAKLAIPTPATGLLIYQTDGSTGLYYYNGSAWVQLSAGALSGAGTTNTLAKWTSASGIGNSQLFDNGTNVGVGAGSSPNASARLDVTSTNSGMLIPRVALTAVSDVTTIPAPATSLLVYNTNSTITGGNGKGYYFFDGAAWSKLSTESNSATVFSYTGVDQSYTVPAGVTSITVKMWGAGGGGGYYGGWTNGFAGGAGGFTKGTIAVTAGQVLTVIVGGGGLNGSTANTSNSYGGGAKSCIGSDCRYGGQGGGRSAIRLGATELVTAGGGGGGGSSRNYSLTNYGGAGGGLIGQDGSSDAVPNGKGMGGTQSAGGVGGNTTQGVAYQGASGTQFTGGAPAINAYGGGGGGGWWGGGGGSYQESNTMSGAGGGSGYVGGAGVTNAFTVTGNFAQPPQTWDANYANGIAIGGPSYGTGTANGGNGRVVIITN